MPRQRNPQPNQSFNLSKKLILLTIAIVFFAYFIRRVTDIQPFKELFPPEKTIKPIDELNSHNLQFEITNRLTVPALLRVTVNCQQNKGSYNSIYDLPGSTHVQATMPIHINCLDKQSNDKDEAWVTGLVMPKNQAQGDKRDFNICRFNDAQRPQFGGIPYQAKLPIAKDDIVRVTVGLDKKPNNNLKTNFLEQPFSEIIEIEEKEVITNQRTKTAFSRIQKTTLKNGAMVANNFKNSAIDFDTAVSSNDKKLMTTQILLKQLPVQ